MVSRLDEGKKTVLALIKKQKTKQKKEKKGKSWREKITHDTLPQDDEKKRNEVLGCVKKVEE
jgi:hypothetical protein